MGTGYTRNDTANNIADGNVINASDLDGEFDAIQAAFNATTGHSHDGTSGEGPQITAAGIANDAVALGTKTTGNYVAAGAVSGVGLSGSASSEGATFTVTSNATDANTASTIVARDASGNFSAGTITASLTGTASNAALLDSLDSTQFLRSDVADTKTSGDLSFADNVKATFGAGNDLQIYHDATDSHVVTTSGDLNLQVAGGGTINLGDQFGNTLLKVVDNADVKLYHGTTPSQKLATTSSGINVTGTTYTDGIVVEDDGSGSPLVNVRADDGNPWAIRIANDTYSTGNNDGWGVYVQNTGTATHEVRGNGAYLPMTFIQNNGSASREVMRIGDTGYFRALYQGSTRLDTTSTGIDVTGEVQADSLDIDGAADISGQVNFHSNVVWDDNNKLIIGNGSDLQIYHDGLASYIKDAGTGQLNISGSAAVNIQDASGNNMLRGVEGAQAALFYAGSQKMQTTSGGVTITGECVANSFNLLDNNKVLLGNGGDLQIYHNGSNSFIDDAGTGNIYLRGSSQVIIGNMTGEQAAVFNDNGAVTLNYDNVQKLATTAYGIDISGSAVADTQTTTGVTGSQTPDMSSYQNFVWTLSGNITLANPTTEKVGQTGFFVFIHSGAARTVSLGTQYRTVGGAGLTLSSTVGAVDFVPYAVRASGIINLGTPQLGFA